MTTPTSERQREGVFCSSFYSEDLSFSDLSDGAARRNEEACESRGRGAGRSTRQDGDNVSAASVLGFSTPAVDVAAKAARCLQ